MAEYLRYNKSRLDRFALFWFECCFHSTMIKPLLFLFVAIALHFSLFAQAYDPNYFRSPLDIPLLLSGNFAELRSNHFHAGIDIKTEGVEGKKVYAAAEGYVSRIKISPYGYGKAIYITHPNGYTTVYGHLKKFSDRIEKVVKAEQYRRKSFSVQLFPSPFSLSVEKGEIIAYSGNTGGSGGPHLHFETRETKSEHPVNPLFFGFYVKDHRKPEIRAITFYTKDDNAVVNGYTQSKRFKVQGGNGNYSLAYPIKLNGTFGVGIEAIDRMDLTSNTYGIHNIRLYFDEQLIFEQQIDEYAFHEDRYLNALIDYETYIKYRRRVQKSFKEPGNQLGIYKTLVNNGIFKIDDQKVHTLKYVLTDVEKNQSTLTLQLIGDPNQLIKTQSELKPKAIKFFPYNQRNTFLKDEVLVDIPKGALYNDLYFEYNKGEVMPKTISPLYQIHNHFTPLHNYINVSIKMRGLSSEQRQKALIVSTTDGKSWYAEGGKWNGENLTVRTRSFGGYAVALDTIAPSIKAVNIYPGANLQSKWSIMLKIKDNLAGIASYAASVDGEWILMEYDAKKELLFHLFDDRISAGKHQFKLVVKDKVGNEAVFESSFVR